MAETTVPAGLTVQQWDSDYFREYLNSNFFKQFMGTGAQSMIHVKQDLTTKPGNKVTFTLINRLSGEALGENDVGEGNEEEATLRSATIQIREYFKPVTWKKFEAQKTAIEMRQAVKDVLMDWNMELDRDNVIRALGSVNGVKFSDASEGQKDAWLADNSDRVLFGALKSNTEADFDFSDSVVKCDASSDKFNAAAISLMKRMAKTASPKIRPIRPKTAIGKSDYYIAFAPTECVRDLMADDTIKNALRDADVRGSSNKLFTGASIVWDNVAVYEIEDIPSLGGVGDNGSIVRPVYLCGAQALGMAWAMRPKTVEESFDYGRRVGLGIKQWYEIDKLRFGTAEDDDTTDPKDHGVVTGFFAAAADA
ncbi:MAG: DUF4043 family protein [Hyphomicrobiaceae bacterium]